MTEATAPFAPRLSKVCRLAVDFVVLGLLVIATSVACYGGIVWYLGNIHVVDEGKLYRSSRLERDQLEQVIRKYGIKSIPNVRGETKCATFWK
jgi:hypothetical protein